MPKVLQQGSSVRVELMLNYCAFLSEAVVVSVTSVSPEMREVLNA